jgi:DNA-binding transcriptional MerR regulator
VVGVAELLPIGAFSRAVLISPKTLRDYHEAGLLTPAVVDPRTGYRGYRPAQLGEAAVIRELWALDVPLAEITQVLRARHPDVTRAVLTAHQERVREQAERLRRITSTLDDLLADPAAVTRLAVLERDQPSLPVLAIRGNVAESGWSAFLDDSYNRLLAELACLGLAPAGPVGAMFPGDQFSDEPVEVVAFVPTTDLLPDPVGRLERPVRRDDPDTPTAGAPRPRVLPAGRVAVATFVGPYTELSAGYRAVGAWLAGRQLTTAGPVVETYLVGPESGLPETEYRTEIAWPVREGDAA